MGKQFKRTTITSALPYAKSVHLGRRILRAETAGISILAAWNQINGWI